MVTPIFAEDIHMMPEICQLYQTTFSHELNSFYVRDIWIHSATCTTIFVHIPPLAQHVRKRKNSGCFSSTHCVYTAQFTGTWSGLLIVIHQALWHDCHYQQQHNDVLNMHHLHNYCLPHATRTSATACMPRPATFLVVQAYVHVRRQLHWAVQYWTNISTSVPLQVRQMSQVLTSGNHT